MDFAWFATDALGIQEDSLWRYREGDGPMNDRDIVCLATTSNQALAHFWRNALENEGIQCEVGEALTFWINNEPQKQADVWVPRVHVDRAQRLLEGGMAREAVMIH